LLACWRKPALAGVTVGVLIFELVDRGLHGRQAAHKSGADTLEVFGAQQRGAGSWACHRRRRRKAWVLGF
jgi:hypothetical protein